MTTFPTGRVRSAANGVAVLGLTGALIQDIRIGRRLARQGYGRIEPTPLGQVMGVLVLAVGIVGVVISI
ncbi:MAG: hypothetical protein OET79_07970 [Nitrospirota bacterium]|nr:hypothetical protein [Nitrospirota bacterium]